MARPTKKIDLLHSKKFRSQVEEDINNNKLNFRVENFYEEFIKFACLERMYYEPDIFDEIESFLNRKRMYSTNVKEWKRISKHVFNRDKYTCQYCHVVGGILEVDHIIPFSKGGSDDFENLVTSCRKCNRQKKDKSVEDFLNNKNK